MRELHSRFLKQYMILVCINQMASGLFRAMAAIGRDVIVATTFGTFALLIILVLGGFVLSRGDPIIEDSFLFMNADVIQIFIATPSSLALFY